MITAIVVLSIVAIVLFLVWLLFDVNSIEISINVPSTIVLSIIAIIVLIAIRIIFQGR